MPIGSTSIFTVYSHYNITPLGSVRPFMNSKLFKTEISLDVLVKQSHIYVKKLLQGIDEQRRSIITTTTSADQHISDHMRTIKIFYDIQSIMKSKFSFSATNTKLSLFSNGVLGQYSKIQSRPDHFEIILAACTSSIVIIKIVVNGHRTNIIVLPTSKLDCVVYHHKVYDNINHPAKITVVSLTKHHQFDLAVLQNDIFNRTTRAIHAQLNFNLASRRTAYKVSLMIQAKFNCILQANNISLKRKARAKQVRSTDFGFFIASRLGKLTSLSNSSSLSEISINILLNCYKWTPSTTPNEPNLNLPVLSIRTIVHGNSLGTEGMSERNSAQLEDDLLNVDESYEAIEFTESLEISVTDQEIADISNSAAGLEIDNIPKVHINKRYRENSEENSSPNESFPKPPTKKIRKIMMAPPELPEAPAQPVKYLVRLVPDIEEVHLFSKAHLELVHKSVLKAHKEANNPIIKFDFCKPERGRYKFVCPNEERRDFANNIVPLLKNLWKDPKIQAIDYGEVPRMIRGSVTFENPPPEMLDFFEDVDLLNETIDTNDWRVYGRKPARGNKTAVFIGMDEKSVADLRAIGSKPYFASGRVKISFD